MQCDLPIFDSAEDALRYAIQHLGGAKKVAPLLWGADKSPDHAARALLDCLNPDRAEKLSLAQTMQILRMARAAGYHSAMQWFAAEIGYDVHPVSQEEEVDRIATVLAEASKVMSDGILKLERLQRGGIQVVGRR